MKTTEQLVQDTIKVNTPTLPNRVRNKSKTMSWWVSDCLNNQNLPSVRGESRVEVKRRLHSMGCRLIKHPVYGQKDIDGECWVITVSDKVTKSPNHTETTSDLIPKEVIEVNQYYFSQPRKIIVVYENLVNFIFQILSRNPELDQV